MRWSLPLGRIRGISLKLHVSFLLVIPLLAPAFAAQLGAALSSRGVEPGMGLLLGYGVLMVLGLFASVLLHELAHALYALSHGGRVSGITLMMIGGVTQLEESPKRPRDEAWMALVGPLCSLVLGAALLGLAALLRGGGGMLLQLGLFTLGAMNLGLGLFNLLPAFPMDGGRILRAVLTPRLGAARATRVASRVGQAFAVLFGILGLVTGNFLLVLVALFVLMGAATEAQQAGLREVLEPMRVGELLDPPTGGLRPDDTLELALESFTLRRAVALPVVDDDGRAMGVLTLERLRRVPSKLLPTEPVVAHLQATDSLPTSLDGWEGLKRLSAARLPMLPVCDAEGTWIGNLSQESLGRAVELARAQGEHRINRPNRHQPA